MSDVAEPALAALALSGASQGEVADRAGSAVTACFHCGAACGDGRHARGQRVFCCQGCLIVHDLLAESGLGQYYELERHPGARIGRPAGRERWAFLDRPAVQEQLLDFTDGKVSRLTLRIPAIHCAACVWLLENLFRLHAGIGQSQVNFPKQEVAIAFAPGQVALSEVVALLASIGYEPQLTLGELERRGTDQGRRRRWLQLGIAGFAFGNIMLFSLPVYFGLDSLSGPLFRVLFGYLSLGLAAPVLCYSASDYWRSAALSLRQRLLTLDVPIALGLAALYARSAYEIVSGQGAGYLDSLAGLVFFLLCGRAFQQKAHERMAFDRDYKSFFPLSVIRLTPAGEASVALSELRVGDRLRLRHGELIPADARLVSGPALVDYSFVTGESEPVAKETGAYLFAGGQQVGGAIEVETVKAVSQSYLMSLWDHETFRKRRPEDLNTLTNRYSRWFTLVVVGVALGAGLGWLGAGQTARGLRAAISVLIVACPCALALAAPFAFGTAQRLLARLQVFLKNGLVLERMARVDTIVFDKTGTLTVAGGSEVTFLPPDSGVQGTPEGRGLPVNRSPSPQGFGLRQSSGAFPFPGPGKRPRLVGGAVQDAVAPARPPASAWCPCIRPSDWSLSPRERLWVRGLAGQSQHPYARRIAAALADAGTGTPASPAGAAWSAETGGSVPSSGPGAAFVEMPGRGIEGKVEGHQVRLGSAAWLQDCGVVVPGSGWPGGSVVGVAVDGVFRGVFVLAAALRPETATLLGRLSRQYELALLSGDNEQERARFQQLFGRQARLHFNQSPLAKLEFIRALQARGRRVMMVGDGLNDAGALKQSEVGVAVVEKVGAFSPASDVILEAGQVPQLCKVLALARWSTRIVRLSFGISALYNLVGITIAAWGVLSPVICAVLMPLSSVSVVLFACGATKWATGRAGLRVT